MLHNNQRYASSRNGGARSIPKKVSFNSSDTTADTTSSRADINPCQLMFLSNEGFPNGLAKEIAQGGQNFTRHFWIIDNSESMNKRDGHIINQAAESVKSTRWEEIKECVNYHVNLAAQLFVPSTFRLLNNPTVGPQELSLARKELGDVHKEMKLINKVLNKSKPSGFKRLLTNRILEVHDYVSSRAEGLRQNGQQCFLMIATGGEPTDENGCVSKKALDDFVRALEKLGSLPIWIVLRLCTDDKKVVSFYQKLDKELDFNLEVLDDHAAEAQEVYSKNPWLNYGLPLHRARENGITHKVFDLIDERKLTASELQRFCYLLFGNDSFDRVPDPNIDWLGFVDHIGRLNSCEENTLNPIKNEKLPWIDMKVLGRMYGKSMGDCLCVIS